MLFHVTYLTPTSLTKFSGVVISIFLVSIRGQSSVVSINIIRGPKNGLSLNNKSSVSRSREKEVKNESRGRSFLAASSFQKMPEIYSSHSFSTVMILYWMMSST